MRTDLVFRIEKPDDHRIVELLIRDAFWNVYVPGCDEHYLAHRLRTMETFIPELNFVAEHFGKIVGNIMYVKTMIIGDDGVRHPVVTFGPVSVKPSMQGYSIGSLLIRYSLKRARIQGFDAVLIYGDPDYYSKFGFLPAESFHIGTSDGFYADALLALELKPGSLKNCAGLFFEGKAYEIDDREAASFDKRFPQKKPLSDLPSQKRFIELNQLRKPRNRA